PTQPAAWSPTSWQARLATPGDIGGGAAYTDPAEVRAAMARLATLPPLVTSWEIERLKAQIAEAQQGRRFLLQGGDCAETLADCTSDAVTAKLKILLQMSLVLVYAGKRPVIRVARLAGQYAKPRSSPTETRGDLALPSYFGDLINSPAFTPEARRPDPGRMVTAYQHAALTLNFVRSLLDAGFADVHHPEYWDLGFFRHASLRPELRSEYQALTSRVSDGLRFMQAMDSRIPAEPATGSQSVELYTSHEGLNLWYETAQTRTVPRRDGHYNLAVHLPWIGERTRALDGPHVEYFRGIRNPVGIKLGPSSRAEDVLRLIDALNPADEPGKMVLIPRMGAKNVAKVLPGLVEIVQRAGRRVLWVCDPMHGNGLTTSGGVKTRNFDDILFELEQSWEIHRSLNSHLGGVHIELTGEDVTECIGGAAGLAEADLQRNYASLCDPRLNYEQALELAFRLAHRMAT
ncbi:MAG: 3-deoxy-7-phosphoheptulonate synthase, partial [Planctomycetaceae bacterium]|nr:3-deoxy-7-phosphoheptulonate synthase [Planctomycetaceae bacterium]